MHERIYIALDVETTGFSSEADDLIEIAAVKFRGDELLDQYSCFIRPYRELPLHITRLTGITPADLVNAPRFNDVGTEYARFIATYPIVGHSVGFDLGMLRARGMNFAQPVYDTFELATLLIPNAPTYKLGALAAQVGIPHPHAHRALEDAKVSARLFTHLTTQISSLSLDQLTEITRLMAKITFPMRDLFDAALRQRARQIFVVGPGPAADLLRATPEAVPLKPTGNARPIDLAAVEQFFAPTGALGRSFVGYEPRTPQVAMARAVAKALNSGEPLMVEAGTGTGKSMAYLAPATMFALQRGERVVISTNTINLQDQLFFKDIPELQRIMSSELGSNFHAALLKGRSNYLCLKRYHELRRNENLTPDEARALLKVQFWLPVTTSGDKAEIRLFDREARAWERINVTPETCNGPRCPHFRDCFFFRARRTAEAAHILVVNHALLIADLASQSNVLPAYDHLVIDEAHNLEDVATDQLSFVIEQDALIKFLDDLFQSGGAQTVSGLLSELPVHLQAYPGSEREEIERAIEQIYPTLIRARTAVYHCFNLLNRFMSSAIDERQYDPRLRLTTKLRQQADWQIIQSAWGNLSDTLAVIGTALATIELQLRNLQRESAEGVDDLLLRVELLNRFAVDVRVNGGHIIFGNETNISWITLERSRDALTLTAAPLTVAEILQAQLFAQKQTSILASATLSIEAGFSFIKERLGLEQADELLLESPFDYEQQSMLYIPNDMPEPNQRGYQQALEQALIALCSATGGRTLVLFTANNALRQTHGAILEPLEDRGITVLGQGIDGSRRALIDRFKESPRTVLLGTNSFWEGVDVIGDALSVLVIAKLPFAVPTDPIFAARSEQFADPFGQFSVPQSILRFKQGFGRLIRSREDRGIVVVLDSRLLSKQYGSQFLGSLPHTRVRTGPLKQLPQIADRFLGPET